MRLTHGQHCYTDTLFHHFLGMLHLQPQRITPNCERFVEAVNGDSNVVDFHQRVSCFEFKVSSFTTARSPFPRCPTSNIPANFELETRNSKPHRNNSSTAEYGSRWRLATSPAKRSSFSDAESFPRVCTTSRSRSSSKIRQRATARRLPSDELAFELNSRYFSTASASC